MTTAQDIHLRPGLGRDLPILEAMLFEAFHWHPEMPRPTIATFRHQPEFVKLLSEWGHRRGDTAVVAEIRGRPIGAAWYRFWSPELHSYGYVDESYPEIGMGVASPFRSRGAGRALLDALIAAARTAGLAGLSLSVDRSNFARQLYESVGFRAVDPEGHPATGGSLTLLLEL